MITETKTERGRGGEGGREREPSADIYSFYGLHQTAIIKSRERGGRESRREGEGDRERERLEEGEREESARKRSKRMMSNCK